MSKLLESQLPKIKTLADIENLKIRRLMLKEFSKDPDFCEAVREIATNFINKNVILGDQDKKKLRKYKQCIICLSQKHKSCAQRMKAIQQTGTGIFLPVVLPLVLSAIADLIKT